MRTTIKRLIPVSLAVLLVAASGAARIATSQTPAAGTDQYVWAEACASCHKEIYAAWEKTKHAKALNRLSAEDQQKECIGCHVTGAKMRIEKDGKLVNGGVQCESCHGAGAAHVANPETAHLAKKPNEASCVECHNKKSPSFRGFFYAGMTGFVHPVRK
jgi:hypothetical protein